MNVLFVEDSDDKRTKILELFSAAFPSLHVEIARSFNEALRRLVLPGAPVDFILLDMSMPNYDGSDEPPESFAGRDLLRQLKLRGRVRPTIVVTQLDSFGVGAEQLSLEQLDRQLSEEIQDQYLGLVYFSSVNDGWRVELSGLVKKATEIA